MIKLHRNAVEAEEHFNIVLPLIKTRLTNILDKGIKKDKKSINLSRQFRSYLETLKKEDEIRKIILAEPENLRVLITTLQSIEPKIFSKGSDENHVIRNIFINHCYNKIEKLKFIKRIDRDTCPYCNRNYIYSLNRAGSIKPPIDHFYPKGKYPIFGVSFYNLIPSCETCNGFGGKGEEDPVEKDLVSPYELSGQEFSFTYKVKSIDFINPLSDHIGIDLEMDSKIEGNASVFGLQELYARHTDHVRELIVKSKIQYSRTYRQHLKSITNYKLDDHEIDRMILGNYSKEEEIHKRPLAKLYQDIGKKLGLI